MKSNYETIPDHQNHKSNETSPAYRNLELDLTPEQQAALERQDSRPVSTFRVNKFDQEAKKHWDIFYKRNETRFFKDRHWTTREFTELCNTSENDIEHSKKVLVEIGCGVGNFAFPLLEDESCNLFIYVCDFSPRAVDFVKSHSLYDENRIGKFRN
jgi:methyltransferase-like protein 6